jgi:hypothetical protein
MVYLDSAGQMPGPNRMACGHRKWARASWAPYSIEGWPGAGVNRVALPVRGEVAEFDLPAIAVGTLLMLRLRSIERHWPPRFSALYL